MVEEHSHTRDAGLYGGLMALQFMVEGVVATLLHHSGMSASDAKGIGQEMLRQFEDLKPVNDAPADNFTFETMQSAIDRIERMWVAIEGRLADEAAHPKA